MNGLLIHYIIFCYSFSLGCVVCEGVGWGQGILLVLAPITLPLLILWKSFVWLRNTIKII